MNWRIQWVQAHRVDSTMEGRNRDAENTSSSNTNKDHRFIGKELQVASVVFLTLIATGIEAGIGKAAAAAVKRSTGALEAGYGRCMDGAWKLVFMKTLQFLERAEFDCFQVYV
ncbi:hypothetical protein FRX31_009254 [Thalictrum thalictroides]|uniref:Uncharacterized protein n=1 Tax=Thalictrum thalictroides TaxID=46969 RepID=A0A7J6WUT9_THATH|nr:hypothetical protein FRX31_009254 [Thalictrum thalictroides]